MINQAQRVNAILGGPFIAPWELGSLPGDYLDTILALGTDLSKMKKALDVMASSIEKMKKDHPTYRK